MDRNKTEYGYDSREAVVGTTASTVLEVANIYIYPDNLKAKATLWLWNLRDVGVIGIGLILSALALLQLGTTIFLVATFLYAILSIRLDGVSILDFLHWAAEFFFLKPQYYEWRSRVE